MSVVNLGEVPASVQLDLCDLAYRKATEYFKDLVVQARYKVWLAERKAKLGRKEADAAQAHLPED